jgi:hypothetical protein
MIAEPTAFVCVWTEPNRPLQILTQNQPFRTAVLRFAQHNEITIGARIDFGVEVVTADTDSAREGGLASITASFLGDPSLLGTLVPMVSNIFQTGGVCGLLSWLLIVLISQGSTILRTLRSP